MNTSGWQIETQLGFRQDSNSCEHRRYFAKLRVKGELAVNEGDYRCLIEVVEVARDYCGGDGEWCSSGGGLWRW